MPSTRKEADKLTFTEYPTVHSYYKWKIDMANQLFSSSLLPDQSIGWFWITFEDDTTFDNLASSGWPRYAYSIRDFDTLDAKFAAGLMPLIKKGNVALSNELYNLQHTLMTGKPARALKGRQILRKIHESFQISTELETHFNLQALRHLQLKNDDLRTYLTKWDELIGGMKKNRIPIWLRDYFLPPKRHGDHLS